MPAPRHPIPRARRKRAAWGDHERAIHTRHRWQVEGAHGTVKTLHGPARVVRRGHENMKIQALLTAMAMNIKTLAVTMPPIWLIIENRPARPSTASVRNDFSNSPRGTDFLSGGQVERMNRTIKDVTVKRFHYETHYQLRTHLADLLAAYNFARSLKRLNGLTPYEYICEIWASEPDRFILNPIHQMPD